jgi:cell division protein FtsL
MATAETETLRATQETGRRRFIYNGETASPPAQQNDFAPRGNRAIAKKRRSPLPRIGLLLAVSLVIVFYVWNKITVNRLLGEVNDLNTQYQKLQTGNDLLRAEINKKASIERIGTVAAKIGLVYPKQQPIWFETDADLMERFRDK